MANKYISIEKYVLKVIKEVCTDHNLQHNEFVRECIKFCLNDPEIIKYIVAKKYAEKQDRIRRLKEAYNKL